MNCPACNKKMLRREVQVNGVEEAGYECEPCDYIDVAHTTVSAPKEKFVKITVEELKGHSKAHTALDDLGLPDTSDPKFFEAVDAMKVKVQWADKMIAALKEASSLCE